MPLNSIDTVTTACGRASAQFARHGDRLAESDGAGLEESSMAHPGAWNPQLCGMAARLLQPVNQHDQIGRTLGLAGTLTS